MLPKHLVGFPRAGHSLREDQVDCDSFGEAFQCFLSIWWDFHVFFPLVAVSVEVELFQCFLSIWWDFHSPAPISAPAATNWVQMFQCFLSIWWDFHSFAIVHCACQASSAAKMFQCFLSIWWDFHVRVSTSRGRSQNPGFNAS